LKRSTDSPSKKIRAFLVFALVGGILVLITYSLLNTIVLKTTNISDYSLISEQLLGLKGKKNILVLFKIGRAHVALPIYIGFNNL